MGLYHKIIAAVINYVTKKASVFVKANKKWLPIAKALAYCTTEEITPVNVLRYYCIEGTEMRQLGFKVRRLLFLNRY